MLLAQGRLVAEASSVGAGIIFCPPDLIWSRGSFHTIIRLARQGVRAIIGPSARVIEEDLEPILTKRIANRGNGRLDLSADEIIAYLFGHWQKMNDGFIWNTPASYVWKSYAYYKIDDHHLLMKFFQGPATFLWPHRPVTDYVDWIDHRLIKQCARNPREIYVVRDVHELMTIDLAPRERREGHFMTASPALHLFRQFLNRKRHSSYNLIAGRYNCRLYDTALSEKHWRAAERTFNCAINPIVILALAARPPLAIIDSTWRHSKIPNAIHRTKSIIRDQTRTILRISTKAPGKKLLFKVVDVLTAFVRALFRDGPIRAFQRAVGYATRKMMSKMAPDGSLFKIVDLLMAFVRALFRNWAH